MWLKATIIINFVLLLISLFSSLFVVYKDKGTTNRPLVLLSVRVSLAVLLMIQIGYGLASGKLGSAAPWDHFAPAARMQTPTQSATVSPEASAPADEAEVTITSDAAVVTETVEATQTTEASTEADGD